MEEQTSAFDKALIAILVGLVPVNRFHNPLIYRRRFHTKGRFEFGAINDKWLSEFVHHFDARPRPWDKYTS